MHQDVTVSGDGNIVVQVAGNDNQVVVGAAHLILTRYLSRQVSQNDLDLLSPYSRAIPLVGRSRELASLERFVFDERSILVKVLVGGGGSGKTRLALELCDRLSAQDWAAGFVSRRELRRFSRLQNLSLWGWNRPTLIVVDYAAEHAHLLSEWFGELSDRLTSSGHPLRFLLIERTANLETGWWTTIFSSGGWGAVAKRALLDQQAPMKLSPLIDPSDRLSLSRGMLRAIGSVSDERIPDGARLETAEGDPLYLLMLTLGLRGDMPERPDQYDRTGLAFVLAQREIERLKGLADAASLCPIVVQHLTAIVTICQGLKRDRLAYIAPREKEAIGRPSGGDAAPLADLLHDAMPRGDEIAPLLPDLIGGALLVKTFKGDVGVKAVLRIHQDFGRTVIQTIVRTIQDFVGQSDWPMLWLDELLTAMKDDERALAILEESLPSESVALRKFNLRAASRRLELLECDPSVAQDRKASALLRVGVTRAMAGEFDAAYLATRDAVGIYKNLVAVDSNAHEPDFARAMNNLANRLSDVGQQEAALLAAEEAVSLYRRLCMRDEAAFAPSLAITLTNLACRLGGLGKNSAALSAAEEAVSLRRILVARNPEAFEHSLATSLSTLANRYFSMRDAGRAIAVGTDAVELHRQHARSSADMHSPSLAMALNNLAVYYAGSGQPKVALTFVSEAIKIRRELTIKQPDAFYADLANSLINRARFLEACGLSQEAYIAGCEAVDIFTKLSTKCAGKHDANLARSKITLALSISKLHGAHEARSLAESALTLLIPLCAKCADAYSSVAIDVADKYLIFCNEVGVGPDSELLARLEPFKTCRSDPQWSISE